MDHHQPKLSHWTKIFLLTSSYQRHFGSSKCLSDQLQLTFLANIHSFFKPVVCLLSSRKAPCLVDSLPLTVFVSIDYNLFEVRDFVSGLLLYTVLSTITSAYHTFSAYLVEQMHKSIIYGHHPQIEEMVKYIVITDIHMVLSRSNFPLWGLVSETVFIQFPSGVNSHAYLLNEYIHIISESHRMTKNIY